MRRFGLFAIAAAMACAAENTAVIDNSGSTNTPGYRITIERSGTAEYSAKSRRPSPESAKPVRRKLSAALVKRLYSDLDAAKPLSALPPQHCVKSASFGSTLTIEYAGNTTPDLSCPSTRGSHVQALARDANDIVKIFRTQ